MSNLFPTPSLVTRDESSATETAQGVPCWIGFGGNVGDVTATFNAALALLSLHRQISLGKRSGIYGTAPVGSHAGQPFLNGICGLTTWLSSYELLHVLQSVENQLGRTRDLRWGPRTLDLDLISYGQTTVDESYLTIPHPALTCRRFVLDPLAEVEPDWRHPLFSLTASQLKDRLSDRPLQVRILGCKALEIEKLNAQLSPSFPDLRFVSEDCESSDAVLIRPDSSTEFRSDSTIDVSRFPGCMLERLTAAFTAIFDIPRRISDW